MDELSRFLSLSEPSCIIDICEPLRRLGIKGFFYVRLYDDGTFVDLATDLKWAEHYLRNLYSSQYSLSDLKDIYLSEGINL